MTSPDLRAVPKIVLHDHLDGGLRAGTVVDLAREAGHPLPTRDPRELASWFVAAANSGSLERYLETFDHTVAVMQTASALHRVAREAVLDLAADGAIYAELRWAPEQHERGGLSMQQAVDAVQRGIEEGIAEASESGQQIQAGQIVTAMRHADRWEEVARLAVANRERGVVGFDLAGAEAGFPADRIPGTWRYLADEAFPVTIHAGEADGVESVACAVHRGQAVRLGHGVRVLDDILVDDQGVVTLGRTASWLRDQQIPLELCPSSNIQTGAAPSVAQHGISVLRDLDFAVTVNTDNRLVSGTSMTREMTLLADEAGWLPVDLLDVTLAAAWSAFVPHGERLELARAVIAGFEAQGVGTADEAPSP